MKFFRLLLPWFGIGRRGGEDGGGIGHVDAAAGGADGKDGGGVFVGRWLICTGVHCVLYALF